MKYLWKIWANALGVKADDSNNSFSDHVAIARTIILLIYLIASLFIIISNIRHW